MANSLRSEAGVRSRLRLEAGVHSRLPLEAGVHSRLRLEAGVHSRLRLERVAGIEPASSAWKAEVLPLNYTRRLDTLVVGEGFEPSKAKPSDLQSDPFDHSGTPPAKRKMTPTPPVNAVDEGVKYLFTATTYGVFSLTVRYSYPPPQTT